MNRMIYGESVQGASHLRSGKPCQDNYKIVEYADNIAVIAVADGHGSDSCPYSQVGSATAVNVFCQNMTDLLESFGDNMDLFITYLNREGEVKFAQSIDEEWQRRIQKTHKAYEREMPLTEDGEIDEAALYRQYGTTLLGLLITDQFVFAYQMGDGDILFIDRSDIQPVIEPEKILGIETHSLSKPDAWRKAITAVYRKIHEQESNGLFLMSTDGFSNSYKSEGDFKDTCRAYYDMLGKHGFKTVAENLGSWLSETSEFGCGDDITVVLTYFSQEECDE